jgi:hypothetical protein
VLESKPQIKENTTRKPKSSATQKTKTKPIVESKVMTKEDLKNITEEQIYQYMSRAGTKKPEIQEIIFEQASIGAKNNLEILKNVVKVLKKNRG